MTQTMRERLIEKARDDVFSPKFRQPGDVWVQGDVNLTSLVDSILAELREPDDALFRIGQDADEGCGCPCCAAAVDFTAMIDAVRGGA